MKKISLMLSAVVITAIMLSSCEGGESNEKSASNEESASTEVTIGSQVWMTKNLDVATFRNGDPILEAKTNEEWVKAGENKQPAWCYYDNDPKNGTKYGKLYNWYAVNDSRGLAPAGWHIPTDAEWTTLENQLGDDAGKKMKSTSGWNNNGNGTNESGFSGLPGGYRDYYGSFLRIGFTGYWWSSTENSIVEGLAASRYLIYVDGGVWRGRSADHFFGGDNNKEGGLSVRCLRD